MERSAIHQMLLSEGDKMNYHKSEAKAAARAQFRGVWAAITTPFTPDDQLDEAGLRRNMRHFTDGLGVNGRELRRDCRGPVGLAMTQGVSLRGVERRSNPVAHATVMTVICPDI